MLNEKMKWFVKLYYWGTPLFLLLDLLGGGDFRVSALSGFPLYKTAYYILCFACLGFILWKPRFSVLVGMIESSVNILILCLGILLPIWMMGDMMDDTQASLNLVTKEKMINFILSGGICLSSFYSHLLGLTRRKTFIC